MTCITMISSLSQILNHFLKEIIKTPCNVQSSDKNKYDQIYIPDAIADAIIVLDSSEPSKETGRTATLLA